MMCMKVKHKYVYARILIRNTYRIDEKKMFKKMESVFF